MHKWKYSLSLLSVFIALGVILTGYASALDADIAYLVKDANGVDATLTSVFTQLGYSFDVIYESALPTTNLSQYRLLVVGDQRLSSPTAVPIEHHKSLIINSYNYYETFFSYQFGLSKDAGLKSSPTVLSMNLNSPLATGLPSVFNVYTRSDPNVQTSYLKGQKPSGIQIAAYSSNAADAVVATLEPPRQLLGGKILQERLVFFGATRVQYWTPQTKQLFNNSIAWLIYREDLDGDTYLSDLDCNDRDAMIHPGAVEIPYDGIDQDCSGADLVDLDMDGFYAFEVDGDDCDDMNASISPASPSPYYNCRNDVPTLQSIPLIRVVEGQVVSITVQATDPESDELFFEINDTRFDVEDNLLRWQTTHADAGTHYFSITVSDSEFSVSTLLHVEVRNENQPPIAYSIPSLVWDEDTSFTLNLSEYFIDEDSDSLQFGVQATSLDTNIALTQTLNVFTFTPTPNFAGEDWIVFWAYDGLNKTVSERVELVVNQVNDEVMFAGSISNITMDEDTPVNNVLDLSEYFTDPDSDLSFSVEGAQNLGISITQNSMSILPAQDFVGSEVITITASDEESTAQSNEFTITVRDLPEPPSFEPLSCQQDIDEDQTYECEVVAYDVYNNVTFTIASSVNIFCEIINNTLLSYRSLPDASGNASCTIRASNGLASIMQTLTLTINSLDDAPRISSLTPQTATVTLLQQTTKRFQVTASDVDSSLLTISWLVNGERQQTVHASQSSFDFRADPGVYTLEAVVSDNQTSVRQSWIVLVGDYQQFSCDEVGGSICEESTRCAATVLTTSDTAACCLSQCVPAFGDAVSCDQINDSLTISFRKPLEDETYEVGELLTVDLEIRNKIAKEQDLDVKAYLYNLDEDEVVEKEGADLEIDASQTRPLKLQLQVPGDVEVEDSFAIFVRANDYICGQNYTLLELERPQDAIALEHITFPSSAVCGDSITGTVRVVNEGSDDQSVTLSLENRQLKASAQLPSFTLESYGEEDKILKEFRVDIPQNAAPGQYPLTIAARTAADRVTATQIIEIDCKAQSNTTTNLRALPLQKETIKLSRPVVQSKATPITPLLALAAMLFILIAGGALVMVLFSKKPRARTTKKDHAN